MLSQLFEAFLEILKPISTYILLLILIPILYLYSTRNHDYWKKRGVPGPKPLPMLGTVHKNLFSTGPELDKKYFAKYGKLYGTFEGNKPVLFVADPELVKLITVKDWHIFVNRRQVPNIDPALGKGLNNLRDMKWKSVRAVMSATFTSGKIRKMVELMKECLKGLMDNLDKAALNETEVDTKQLFAAYTMDVIARCAFATTINGHNDPDDPFVKHARAIFYMNPFRILMFMLLPESIRSALDIDIIPNEAREYLKTLAYHLLKQRKQCREERNDFLQMLIEAEESKSNLESNMRDINDGHFSNEDKSEIEKQARALLKGASGANLTDDEAMAQIFLFLLAGYETTNTLLTYASYCLAKNPDIQDKLNEELKKAYGNKKDLSYDELNRLEYLNAVISETLRLYPPAMRMDREAGEDYTLGDTGVTITKGTGLFLGFYTLHHDEDNFDEPNAFKPERFLKVNLHLIKPYTYLPFGAGPRNCIGMRFALAEAKLALATVILKYKFVPTEKTKLEFRMHPVLLQCKECIVRVEKR